ncbi:MAG: DUF4846 domain-containing protein [Bacteroidales bacterium]|nr:DUF4846 domain-containing protein [Bacteroidales bacterium]
MVLVFLISAALNGKIRQNKLNAIASEPAVIFADLIEESGMTIESRILPPEGFQRTVEQPNSFESYLRQLPLKPHYAIPRTYTGGAVRRYRPYQAVVDLNIGDQNLHQCADAIMRLKAEYLFYRQQYDKIHFDLTNGFRADYTEWMSGKRIRIRGNQSYWVQSTGPSNTYDDLWQYLEIVFMYAGTASLEQELVAVSVEDVRIGDILIQGGTPGHAMIIVDAAVNPDTGEKVFLLAQSNMPAQDIQVIKNTFNREINPWFTITKDSQIRSGRWTFNSDDLKRFEE